MLPRVLLAFLLLAPLAEARDRAVLIYPRERSIFRRVFYTSHQNALIAKIARDYEVDVHEQIATDDALFALDVDGAKLLVISGHGGPFAIYMGRRDQRTLDSTDRERLTRFFERLDPEATILLQSCHTGRGFAHFVKETAGPNRRVIAARGEIPWNGVEITTVIPFDAKITCAERRDCTLLLR